MAMLNNQRVVPKKTAFPMVNLHELHPAPSPVAPRVSPRHHQLLLCASELAGLKEPRLAN